MQSKKRNHPLKGKTFKEYFGEARAEIIRKSQVLGGGHHNRPIKGQTLESFFGKEKAKKIKQECSCAGKKAVRPVKGKTYEQYYGKERSALIIKRIQNGVAPYVSSGRLVCHGKKSVVSGVYCASTYEDRFVKHVLSFKSNDFSVRRSEYRIRYADGSGDLHFYYPDFVLSYKGVICAVVEVKDEKRLNTVENTQRVYNKFDALRRFCQEHMLTACLYTNSLFPVSANPEPSSLNTLISQMHARFEKYVSEKVQRSEVEDEGSNNTSVGLLTESCCQ